MPNASDDMMDASYGGGEQETEPTSETPPSVDEENASNAEILISKSDLPEGCKEGDTYSFKVSKDYGDEVSLELVKPETSSPQSSSMDEEIDNLKE